MPEFRTPLPEPPPADDAEPPMPDFITEMVEDEETIAAAPDASAFAPRNIHRAAHTALYEKLFFRRTIIPIMLTLGVMLPTIGIWTLADPNAPLAAIGAGVDTLLIVIGLILLALGFLNAFQVKHALASLTPPRSPHD